MQILLLVATAMTLALTVLNGCTGNHGSVSTATQPPAADAHAQTIVTAANTFLASLDPRQRANVLFPFTPQPAPTAAKFSGGMNGRMTFVGEKYGNAVWSNFPVSDVPRPGLAIGGLTAPQRAVAMSLLQTLLSQKGYQKVLDIMDADQVLADAGTPYASGTAHYTIGIFGTPSVNSPWMLQFGGHHLGLNLTIANGHALITPTLTGAQPALFIHNGTTVRPLGAENDKAFALLDALDPALQKQAILNYRVPDLVMGPGNAGELMQPEGLKASAMTPQQRAMLLDLISQWACIVNDTDAQARMQEITAGLDDTYFAWSGPTTHQPGRNGTAYYRIQGPKLVIEFAPQGAGGDLTMHVHTMYRDPTNDYGRALVLQ